MTHNITLVAIFLPITIREMLYPFIYYADRAYSFKKIIIICDSEISCSIVRDFITHRLGANLISKCTVFYLNTFKLLRHYPLVDIRPKRISSSNLLAHRLSVLINKSLIYSSLIGLINGFFLVRNYSSKKIFFLCDPHIISWPFVRGFFKFIRVNEFIFLSHAIFMQSPTFSRGLSVPKIIAPSNYTFFSQSLIDSERASKKYGISNNSIKNTGILRHHPHWLLSVTRKRKSQSLKKIVFISQRINPYNSIQMKAEIIKDIKRLCLEYGLSVTIRMHPKENDEMFFRKIFDADEKFNSWFFSHDPLADDLSDALLTVSIFSSAALDSVAAGVPCIECMTRTLPVAGASLSQSMSPLSMSGITFPVENFEELRIVVSDVMNNPKSLIDYQTRNLEKLFFKPSLPSFSFNDA